jgi:DNA-binding NarL/FixJ family response regulator
MSTVLLIDDHPVVLAACRSVLESLGITAVFDATDVATGYRAFLQYRPDVVVVDLRLHEQDLAGLVLIERIRSYAPHTAILVFSLHVDSIIIDAAIAAGATGYLTKDAPLEELAEAIAQVRSGQPYLDRQLSARVALRRAELTMATLTARERQVLDLVAEGKTTYSLIADELGITNKAATNITFSLRRKLGVKDIPELVRKAVELTRSKR